MISTDAVVEVLRDDLTHEFFEEAVEAGSVAWDIETSGLDWSRDSIGTCQIATERRLAIVVLKVGEEPKYLAALLEDVRVRKVFHHAPFDLRFMVRQWSTHPRNVACTKVASKILDPQLDNPEHSLKPVLQRHLGVEISKDQQVSDWLAPALSEDQLNYAAADVSHLLALYRTLLAKSRRAGVEVEVEASYAYLPTRVSLDLRGSGDVFAY